MPLRMGSMLKAVQTQTPNGTAVNASLQLGLPGLGNDLQQSLQDQEEERRKKLLSGVDTPGSGGLGGSSLLSAAGQIFGMTR